MVGQQPRRTFIAIGQQVIENAGWLLDLSSAAEPTTRHSRREIVDSFEKNWVTSAL